jgi:hypothetical protein
MSDLTTFFSEHGDLAILGMFIFVFSTLFIIMNGVKKIFNLCRCWSDKHTTPQCVEEDTELGNSKHSVNRTVSRTISVSSAATADTIGAADIKPIVPIRQIPRTDDPTPIRQIPRKEEPWW